MSKIFVDQVDPKTATTLTLGTSGDTVSIPSGVTIANAGTATGFGVSLANGVDNRVVTSSSATALNGETNFIYNGTIVGAGADGANADLGEGIHVKTSDIGSVTVDANGKGLVIEKSGSTGLSIITPNDQSGNIFFGDPEEGSQGQIYYSHNDDSMHFKTGAAEKLHLTNAGSIFFPQASQGVYLGVTSATASNLLDDYEHGDWTPTWVLGTSGTQTTSTASGKYVKVGKFVTVWGYNAIGSTNSSPTGSIKIGGLPFTPGSGYGQSSSFYGQGWVSGAWAWGDSASNGYHPRGLTVRTDGLQLITYGVSPNQPYGPGYDMVGQTNTFYTGSSNHCQMYFGAVYRIA